MNNKTNKISPPLSGFLSPENGGTEGGKKTIESGGARTITLIIIHCSAVKPNQSSSARQIDEWHRQRGYKNGIGYHYVIRRDGTIEPGRPEEMVGAHCKDHNKYSIGVCYEGGLDMDGNPADTRTPEQKATLVKLINDLRSRYPRAIVVGHNTLNPQKACPCYKVTPLP